MAKIAISLPDGMFDALEKSRVKYGVSRSEYIRCAVEERLRRESGKEDVARYIQGYLANPETPEEKVLAEATIRYAFDYESWEEEFNR